MSTSTGHSELLDELRKLNANLEAVIVRLDAAREMVDAKFGFLSMLGRKR